MIKQAIVILIFFSFFSCSEGNFLIETEAPRLVVYALFESEQFMTIEVTSTSKPIGAFAESWVENASILIYENGQLLGIMNSSEPGIYSLKVKPKPGAEYQFSVEATGFPSVESTKERMPDFPLISQVIVIDSIKKEDPDLPIRTFSQFTTYFSKAITQSPYFTLSAQYQSFNGSKFYWPSAVSNCTKDIGYTYLGKNGFTLDCFSQIASISLETTNTEVVEQTEGGELIELCQVNQGTHDFNIAVENNKVQEGSGILISPVSIPSNIIGGYGLFSLSNCQTFELQYQ